MKLTTLLASRKFWAAVIGLLIIIIKAFDPNFPLAEDQLTNVAAIIAAYIIGTALDNRAPSS